MRSTSPISTSSLLAAALVVLAGGPGAAAHDTDAEDADARLCRNGLFVASPRFSLAEIVGEDRAYLEKDEGSCPEEGDCARKSYLVAGDHVVVGKLRQGHACVFFAGEHADTAGYLPLDRLQAVAIDTAPMHSAWQGRWSAHGNPDVEIVLRDGTLHISGLATWPGPQPSEEFPSIQTGELDGPLAVHGNRGHYDDGWCRADLALLGEFLVISDNMRCGGVNVTFSSILRRTD